MSVVHYWPMDELSGSGVEDTVGDLGTGQFVGEVADTNDLSIVDAPAGFGKARWLRAVGQVWDGGRINLYAGASDAKAYRLDLWTLSIRYMDDGTRDVHSTLWGMGFWTGGTNHIEVVHYLSGDLGFIIKDNAGLSHDRWGTPSTNSKDGNWHRVTLTYDGSSVRLYWDTQLLYTQALANPLYIYPKGQSLEIGSARLYEATPKLDGHVVVDDAAIFDTVLTSAEIESSEYQDGTILSFSTPQSLPPFITNPTTESRYTVLDIEHDTLGTVRIPISSWQATTQSGRSSFAQAVIPAALAWVDAISDRLDTGVMVVTHGARHIDGTTREVEVIRAPVQQFFLDRGHLNTTARIASYYTVAAVTPASVKILHNIRGISASTAGLRVRCDFDPTLRPGDTVSANGSEYTVAYINAYENGSDRYMDVGERVA